MLFRCIKTLALICITYSVISCSTPARKPAARSVSSVSSTHSATPSNLSKLQPKRTTPSRLSCSKPEAKVALEEGVKLLHALKSKEALKAFNRCLEIENNCVSCLYERGWSFWALKEWKSSVVSWGEVLRLQPGHLEASDYIQAAKERLKESLATKKKPLKIIHPPIGNRSIPRNSPIELTLVARFQSFNRHPTHPKDQFDSDIESPKSARYSADGKKVYVNSLEAHKTIIYDPARYLKLNTISHQFTSQHKDLFKEEHLPEYPLDPETSHEEPNVFSGKPTETDLSHGGRYLWIPYYRRSFDFYGTNPSAVAIIDTQTDKIMRIMATGPISKYVAASPDGRYMAVSHWGDNSLYLIDISSPDPLQFSYKSHLTIERRQDLDALGKVNRDQICDLCLRGLAYSHDGKYLFVARMGKEGGIGVIDLNAHPEPTYLGSFNGMKPKPRDIHVTKSGEWLYMSSTLSGYVSRIPVQTVISAVTQESSETPPPMKYLKGFQSAFVGEGPRSIRLSPDEKYLFAATYNTGQVVTVETSTMTVVSKIAADPFPVGMAISPSGDFLWVTSQSKGGRGGNSVMVFQISYPKNK